jgi:hypothetical protein
MDKETLERATSFDSPLALSLINSIPSPILILKNGHFCGYNRAVGKLFKTTDKSYFKEKKLLDISPEKQPDGSDSSSHIQPIFSKISPGKNVHIEWRFLRADNTTFDSKGIQ